VPERAFEFSGFRVDCDRFELRRDGRSVKLERKPMELLIMLAGSNGRLVTRAEIAERLWDKEVFVDTEHGINTAVRKIRAALRDDSEEPRFVQTVPGMGYRFVAAITPVSASDPASTPEAGAEVFPLAATAAVSAATRELPHPGDPRWKLWIALAASGAVLALILAVTGGPNPLAARLLHPSQHVITSLAVLPLDNLSGDPAQDYFADGMTDELITELAHIPGLRVVSRTSAMQDKGTHKPLQQIAQELNVDAIVEGSVVRSGGRVRITAQLIDVRNDKHLWAQSFEGTTNDVLSLQDSAAREIAAQTRVVLTPAARATLSDSRPVDPAAHDAYLRGRYFLGRRQAEKSAAYFEQAISIDPNYASAYAGLSDALESESLLGIAKPEAVIGKEIEAAKRAIELDPGNSDAYSALGGLETTYEWNWPAAEQDLQRAIELSPSNAYAHLRYAVYLDAMDRGEEAVANMRQALSLDPLSFLMNRHMGSALFFARHYDEALGYLRRAREMEPTKLAVIDCWISWIEEKKGRQDDAVTYDLSALHSDIPGIEVDRLRDAYERGGWKAYWQKRIELETPYAHTSDSCVAYDLGMSYLRLGKRDQAFSRFNDAIDQHCVWFIWAKVDPLLDEVRRDRRFPGLLRRLNLPQ
jgi:TolB-like protein/DNA-binding winged helix-turn-helix (wHTH) protein/Tfp pilus assembly protein PilF